MCRKGQGAEEDFWATQGTGSTDRRRLHKKEIYFLNSDYIEMDKISQVHNIYFMHVSTTSA